MVDYYFFCVHVSSEDALGRVLVATTRPSVTSSFFGIRVFLVLKKEPINPLFSGKKSLFNNISVLNMLLKIKILTLLSYLVKTFFHKGL